MTSSAPTRSEIQHFQRRAAELEVLFQTVQDLTSTLSKQEVIERLVDRTLLHLDSEIASVLLLDGDSTLRIMHARGLPDDVVSSTCVRLGEGISGHVAASGHSVLIEDVERDVRFHRPNHERYYTHSCLSVPLVFHGEMCGVLNVNNKHDQSPFGPEDLRLLEAIACHAAAALGNAHRFEEVLEQSRTDALTGLANHGCFWSILDTEVKRSLRHERPLSVVMIDVDHFKRFNDDFGHRTGDAVLSAVGRLIQDRSRAHDLAARYGGEEFAVILPETAIDGALVFAEKIRHGVELMPIDPDRGVPNVTVSAGVATLKPDGPDSAPILVEAADAQLYRAKSLNRNRVCAPE